MYSVPSLEPVHCSMSGSNCCFLICIQVSQEAGEKSLLEFYCLLWSTVKGFSVVNEAEVDVFLKFPCFFYDPMDVGNLNSGSSAFSKSSLNIWKFSVYILLKPWRILSMEMSAICGSLNILWLLPFLGLEWKLTFSSLVDTAEFSKFAGILTATLS